MSATHAIDLKCADRAEQNRTRSDTQGGNELNALDNTNKITPHQRSKRWALQK